MLHTTPRLFPEVKKDEIIRDLGITHPNALTTRQAAEYLSRFHGIPHAPSTLEVYRSYGKGPSYIRIGSRRIRYSLSALDNYAKGIEVKVVEVC